MIRFFERLAFDRGLHVMFFQLSIFILFDKILNDESIRNSKEHVPLRSFCKKIIRKFFDMAAENKVMFM